jgi:hypothetical protein
MAKNYRGMSSSERQKVDAINASRMMKNYSLTELREIARQYDISNSLREMGLDSKGVQEDAFKHLSSYQGWIAYRLVQGDLKPLLKRKGLEDEVGDTTNGFSRKVTQEEDDFIFNGSGDSSVFPDSVSESQAYLREYEDQLARMDK